MATDPVTLAELHAGALAQEAAWQAQDARMPPEAPLSAEEARLVALMRGGES